MSKAAEKVIATATQEVGYLEKATKSQLDDKTANAGYNNWTKYARDLDNMGVYNGPKNGYAWCAVFVMWCMVKSFGLEMALKITGQPKGGNGASCTSLVSYYRTIGRFFKNNPQPGDQIFFLDNSGNFCHTGLVVKVTPTTIHTIEGNTSSSTGVVANGGAVCNKTYASTYVKIGGYGRPNYDLLNLEEDDDDMTQEKFNEMMDNYWKAKAAEKESYGTDTLEWAKKHGIMQGDEAGRMMPNKFCSRLEALTMLKRVAEKLGLK